MSAVDSMLQNRLCIMLQADACFTDPQRQAKHFMHDLWGQADGNLNVSQ